MKQNKMLTFLMIPTCGGKVKLYSDMLVKNKKRFTLNLSILKRISFRYENIYVKKSCKQRVTMDLP